MAISPFVQRLRTAFGPDLLVLPSVTGIVYDSADRILLVRQKDDDLWSTPGGSIDPNEAPADAVVREVWEETGLYVDPVQILGVYGGPMCEVTYPNGDRTTYVSTVFECVVLGGALRGVSDETTDAAFLSEADLPGYKTSVWAQFLLPKMFGRPSAVSFDLPTWYPPSFARPHSQG